MYPAGMRLGLEHSYAALPEDFYTRVQPAAVKAPRLLAWNAPLAEELGLDATALQPVAHEVFSGQRLPEDANPIAMAYAGHQFGHFVPALGDGRALLLGELRDRNGELRDLQLKGSGRTPWSRQGDGLAAVGPMLREVPQPGAVLTRVARSHVRVGTFEYFAARGQFDHVRTLLDYCIDRHYPELKDAGEDAPLAFLRAVAARQASLVAQWTGVGFIHGVMNTDNMAISGETIDYGPCAFMDHYHPATVFSSIDHRGRYSFGNQAAIAQWNLARLAECLVPLMPGGQEAAVAAATGVLEAFPAQFDAELLTVMRRKLGLATAHADDQPLVAGLLQAMQLARADFTQTFRALADVVEGGEIEGLEAWLTRWRARLALEPLPAAQRAQMLRAANPAFIPRNHRVEAALAAAWERDDLAPFNTLLDLVRRPFDDRPGFESYTLPPEDHERVLATFCGT